MRAILIDPEAKALTEVDIDGGYKGIQKILKCREFTIGAYLTGSLARGGESIYVSDDYIEDRPSARYWFQVDADRDPPSSYPIAGLGLATGFDSEGGEAALRMSVDELGKRITFTQRRLRGFRTREIPGGFQVEMDAPIIDDAGE